jgi:small subunit ribosomal protein S1
MSENGNSPAVIEPSAADADGVSEAIPDSSSDRADSASPAEAVAAAAQDPVAASAEPEATAGAEPDAAAADATVTVEAETDGGGAGTEKAAAPAEDSAGAPAKGKARKGARKRTRRRNTRSEEFVPPTPEDLAGIPSEATRAAVEAGHPVEGKVIGWNQGGFHVVVDGITSFCPRSSMELGAPHEPAHYLDQTYVFRVLRVEERGHRLILSHAAMLREERRRHAEETRARLEIGAILEGRVIALADFGAFVDLGGVEGLIHVSELRHGRVQHPSEVLEVGQEVKAKVIKLGSRGERVSMSLRALEPSPWDEASEKWPAGAKFTGKILRKSDFGWFIELAPGVEGLLHASQLRPGMNPEDPALEPGSEIEGWVRELDLGRRRVSLSLRETPAGNPWDGAEKRYPEGSKITGTVEKVAPFGAFVILEPGLTGLLPTSEMGMPRGASIGKAYPVGKKVTLQVAQVDPRRKRISLTLEGKTLEGSRADYQNYLKKNRRGSGLGALAAALERIKPQP